MLSGGRVYLKCLKKLGRVSEKVIFMPNLKVRAVNQTNGQEWRGVLTVNCDFALRNILNFTTLEAIFNSVCNIESK